MGMNTLLSQQYSSKNRIFILPVPKYWPAHHPEAGKPTLFREKILSGEKKHAIVNSVDWWMRCVKTINEGSGVLSVREQESKGRIPGPEYEIIQVMSVLVQTLIIDDWVWRIGGVKVKLNSRQELLMKNEGMTVEQFTNFFPNRYKGLIIHFTKNIYDYVPFKQRHCRKQKTEGNETGS